MKMKIVREVKYLDGNAGNNKGNNKQMGKKRIQSYIIDKDKIIDKDSFGQIYLCEHEVTHEQYVAKIIDRNKVDSTAYMKNAFHQQIQIQSDLKHNNIVKLVDVLQTTNNYYIVQEYCENGNLRKFLNQQKKLQQPDALHCLKCLCLAFTEIAKSGIIHRDLKPENILIKENTLKITDFGFAKKMMNNRQLTGTTLGTPFYMAPQLLKGQKYSSKCDVWSIGVIYYELLYGTHPWKGSSIHQLVSNVQNIPLFLDPSVKISEESQIFLIETLQVNQNDRLSWLEVFEHRIWKHLPEKENEFSDIAKQWRAGYNRAAEKLNYLASQVQIEELIAAFLQLEKGTLSFDEFKKVIMWLLNVEEEEDIGIMYELFDKDCNGVIDFEEFVTAFGFNDGYRESIEVLQKMLEQGHVYHQMKNETQFMEASKKLQLNEIHAKNAYLMIANIEL